MAVLLFQVGAAAQSFPPAIQLPDLGDESATLITSAFQGSFTGQVVADAGDLNGDGFADLLVTAPLADVAGVVNAGAAYVLFGASGLDTTAQLDPDNLDGTNGFAIGGLGNNDWLGVSGASAGDVNADGFDDLLIGASNASVGPGVTPGVVYVIFGSPSVGAGGTLDLLALDGNNGFAIEGVGDRDHIGESLAGGADLNADGIDDLVIGASDAGEHGAIFDVSPAQVFSVSGGDFDLNGGLDLLSVSQAGDHFTIQYNDGAGNLTPVQYGLPGGPVEVIAADFDQDGLPDLVATTRNGLVGQVALVLNLGGGAFAPEQVTDLGQPSMSLAVGDLNGDSFPDVVATSYSSAGGSSTGEFYVLINDQSGGFSTPVATTTTRFPRRVRLADMDGDLDLDLVLDVAGPRRIEVWKNDGLGGFPTSSATSIPSGGGLLDFALGDLDGDGDTDVVGVEGTTLKFFHNSGSGALTGSAGKLLTWCGSSIALADLDGDLDLDVLVGSAVTGLSNPTGLAVLQDLGGGVLALPTEIKTPGDGVSDLFLGDINGDSQLDVFATMREPAILGGPGDVGLLYGNGDTTFRGRESGEAYVIFGSSTVGGTGYLSVSALDGSNGVTLMGHASRDQLGTTVAVIDDFNADGIADLAVGAPGSALAGVGVGSVYVLFGSSSLGSSAFVDMEDLPSPEALALRGPPTGFALGVSMAAGADFDGDGLGDLVLAVPSLSVAYLVKGSALHGTGASVDLASLDGSDGFRIQSPPPGDMLGAGLSLRSDFNGDGLADWILGAPTHSSSVPGGGRVLVIFGRGGNLFGGQLDPLGLDGLNGFAIDGEQTAALHGDAVAGLGDMNGDGIDEIVMGALRWDYGISGFHGRAMTLYGRNPSGAETYCTAGVTANGCSAGMSAAGIASTIASSGFTLTASDVDGQRAGILFWGTATKATPWGGGSSWLCVAAPTVRTGLQTSAGTLGLCDGAFALDFNAWMMSHPAQAPSAGVTVYAQAWFRDPSSAKGTSLSDGLGFLVLP